MLIDKSKTVILLHFDSTYGLNSASQTIFTNGGVTNFNSNGTVSINTSTKKFGAGSLYFGGGGIYTLSSPPSFFSGTNPSFSIDVWIIPTALNSGTDTIIFRHYNSASENNWASGYTKCEGVVNSSGYIAFRVSDGAGSYVEVVDSTTVVTNNTTHHVCFQYDTIKNRITVGIDGNLTHLPITVTPYSSDSRIYLGYNDYSTTTLFKGYMDEFRLMMGEANYQGSTYTVPTEAYDFLPNTVSSLSDEPTDIVTGKRLFIEQSWLRREKISNSGDFVFPLMDKAYQGVKKIVGTVKNKNTPTNIPVEREVSLFDQETHTLVKKVISDPDTGEFRFENIKDGIYYIVSLDPTLQYNAVIASDRVPEDM